MWCQTGEIRARVVSLGLESTGDLRSDPILQLVPANAGGILMSSDKSLGRYTFDALEYFESRIAVRELTSEIRGDQSQLDMLGLVSREYYSKFKPFRDHIIQTVKEFPSTPVAMLLDTDGKLDSLSALLPIRGLEEIRLKNEAVPMAAAIALVPDHAAARKVVDDSYRNLVSGFYSLGSNKASPPASLIQEKDLGLRTTTYAIDMSWIDQASGGKFQWAGDIQPHYFFIDNYLVVSSAPKLSKRILEAKKSGGYSIATPPSKPMTGFGFVSGKTAAESYMALFKVLLAPLDQVNSRQSAGLRQVLDGFVEAVTSVHEISFRTVQNEDQLETLFIFGFDH